MFNMMRRKTKVEGLKLKYGHWKVNTDMHFS